MLQENIANPIRPSDPISLPTLPLLGPNEPRAPIAILSPAKRAALIACLSGDGTLHKRRGVWSPSSDFLCEKRIAGATVADLGRDGMLTLTVLGRSASARLTTRGSWFARTAAAEMAEIASTREIVSMHSSSRHSDGAQSCRDPGSTILTESEGAASFPDAAACPPR